jgi:hypothetical protein
MVRIYDLVQTALATGYLTIAIEEQLRSLLKASQYEPKDLAAFTKLQQFVMEGSIKQESREQMRIQRYPSDCA